MCYIVEKCNVYDYLSDEDISNLELSKDFNREETENNKDFLYHMIDVRVHITAMHMLENHLDGTKPLSPRLAKKYITKYPKLVREYLKMEMETVRSPVH